MIPVQLNKANFEYDIHSLVKAFFPGEDVLVSTEKKETDERISFHIDIEYIENRREEMEKPEGTEPDRIRIRFGDEQNPDREMKREIPPSFCQTEKRPKTGKTRAL